MTLVGRHVLVLGLGESGLAMARWCAHRGARVRVADSRSVPPNADALRDAAPAAELRCGAFADSLLDGIDLLALSPGVPAETPIVRRARAGGVALCSEIEIFARELRLLRPQAKVLAITGSNGKTTTTALTAALCVAGGRRAVACGNISPAALDALYAAETRGAWPDVWVLELSSFQLEATESLAPAAAAVLNVSEDHLDRYADMAAYAAAKARILRGAGVAVLNRQDPAVASMHSGASRRVGFGIDAPPGAADYGLVDGWIVRGGERLVAAAALRLAGSHNAANAMAALALCEAVGLSPAALVPALCAFAGLPHRVEWVASVAGIDYYDDSKGTNVGATLAALQGLGRKVAIILGGDGKGQDFRPLAPALAAHARHVALIGRDAPAIAAAIGAETAAAGVPLSSCVDMDAAVAASAAAARAGDAVLLSPACASLDMYRNYAHRAEVFVAAVRTLPGARW